MRVFSSILAILLSASLSFGAWVQPQDQRLKRGIPRVLSSSAAACHTLVTSGQQLVLVASPENTGAVEGGTIQTWTDLSGNSFNATQATEAKRPTLQLVNGVWVVRFDGTDDWMSTGEVFSPALAQPNTIIAVLEMRNAEDDLGYAYDGADALGASRHALISNTGSNPDGYTVFAGTVLTGGEFLKDSFLVASAIYNGASSKLYVDGTEILDGDAGANSLTGVTIASRFSEAQFLLGDYRALLVYDSELSDPDRQALEACYGSTVTELNG